MADQVLEALLRASVQGGAYAAAVWVAYRLFPRLPAGVRALLWWLVSLKFLVALAGPAPIPLPVLPASAAGTSGTVVVERTTSVLPASAAADAREKNALPLAAVLLWAGVLTFGLLRGAKQLARARRLRRSAWPAPLPEAETFARLRARLGVRAGVELKLSHNVSAPQVLGPWRPVVLLPAAAEPLPPEELEMALAHELLHVRRKDLWLSLVPETARLLFWFHPLAHLAAREELLAREAACDASVLRALHRAPREYGRLLLRFGIVPSLPGAAQGAPSLQSLRRRLEMLDHVHGKTARLAGLALAVLGLLALVPFAAVARDSSPAPVDSKTASQPEFRLVDTPLAALPASYRGASEEADETMEIDEPDVDVDSGGREVSVVDAQEDAESFILHHGDSTTMFMSTKADGRAFKQLQRKEGDFFYYRDGSRQWVIRDPGILAEAFRILEPMEQLGEQQGAIGEKQGKIGEKQGALGEQQGMLGERMGLLEEEGDRLSDDGGATNHLDRERDTLDSRMEELGAQMEVLGREMEVLGREMDELGAAMDEASKQARDELRRLAEDAVRRGIAKPLAL